MTEPLFPVQTIKYKQYVKETLVQALSRVFASHPDSILQTTKVGIDFPLERTAYPAVVIRFYERQIQNAGVGHIEHIEDLNNLGHYIKYKHYLYQGDVEFAIYALSSYDRDLLADSLVQTLTMGTLEAYTAQFLNRVYNPTSIPSENEGGAYDATVDHMIDLNTDEISGFGETQTLAPWLPEDVLVYQTSYRINIHGQFYSRTPVNETYGLVEHVDIYPWSPDAGETQPDPHPEDTTPWLGDVDGQGTLF